MSQFVLSSYKKFRDIAICDFTKKELEVEKINFKLNRDKNVSVLRCNIFILINHTNYVVCRFKE